MLSLITNLLSFKLFTILLSLILLFSISCSSNEDPEPKYLELSGTWTRFYSLGAYFDLSIDDNGNITLYISKPDGYAGYYIPHNYTYTGKIENNSKYPYTVKLTQTSFYSDGKLKTDAYYNGHTGTITFNNASNCSAKVPRYWTASSRWETQECVFTKK